MAVRSRGAPSSCVGWNVGRVHPRALAQGAAESCAAACRRARPVNRARRSAAASDCGQRNRNSCGLLLVAAVRLGHRAVSTAATPTAAAITITDQRIRSHSRHCDPGSSPRMAGATNSDCLFIRTHLTTRRLVRTGSRMTQQRALGSVGMVRYCIRPTGRPDCCASSAGLASA